MSISYDVFTKDFLRKITEYQLLELADNDRMDLTDSFLMTALRSFQRVCEKYDLCSVRDDINRKFDIEIPDYDLSEIANIVSEGMVVEWLKPFIYRQELLENILNTKDFTTYSPAELLHRVGETFTKAQKDFTNMKRAYSYDNGDLSSLHL